MPGRILDRLVVREFLRLFILFCLGTPFLFILIDVTDNLDLFQDRGLTGGQVLLNYVYQFPLFVLYSFPVAALIATVFTVNTMTRHHEVAAAKAGGVSFHRLFATLPPMGVLLTFAGLGISELVPIGNRLQAELVAPSTPPPSAGGGYQSGRSDFVYRSEDGHVYAVRNLEVSTNQLTGVVIEREGREPDVPGLQIVAQMADYEEPAGDWVLRHGYMRLFYGPGGERTFRFDALRQLQFTETPEELLARPREPEEMGYAELGRFIEILERSGGNPLELRVEQAQKIALPVATFIIILFAMPLGTSAQRGGAAFGIGISLGITVTYLMLFRVAAAVGASGAVPPAMAAWGPNALFGVAALYMLGRVRT